MKKLIKKVENETADQIDAVCLLVLVGLPFVSFIYFMVLK